MFYNPSTFDNPFEFIPERWEREDYKQKRHLVEMVFSAGPRTCIGKNLALTELKIMTIKFMQRYNLEPGKSVDERGIDLPFTLQIKNRKTTLTRINP